MAVLTRSSSRLPQLNLAARRAQNGVTLEQIAASTKISPLFLRAIEAERYEQLPGGIFATNYLRQYAQAAGLDVAELLDNYASATRDREAERCALSARPPAEPKALHRDAWEICLRALGLAPRS